MFSFDRSGAGVAGMGLGAGFCAYTPSQLARRMASKAKVNPVFFIVFIGADLLEVRACCAFIYPDTTATSLVRIYSSSCTQDVRKCAEPSWANFKRTFG